MGCLRSCRANGRRDLDGARTCAGAQPAVRRAGRGRARCGRRAHGSSPVRVRRATVRRGRAQRPNLGDHRWPGPVAGLADRRRGDLAAHAQGRRDRCAGCDHRSSAHGHRRGEHATSTLELDSAALVELARRFPQILINVIQTQRERLFRASARSAALFSASARSAAGQRGEEIALVAGPSLAEAVGRLVAAARTASPRPVTFLDRSLSFAGALTASDDLASENATVLIPAELDPDNLGVLLDEVDRVVCAGRNRGRGRPVGEDRRGCRGTSPRDCARQR